MKDLGRRNLLKMILGVGAAAACGLSATQSVEAKDLAAPAAAADAGEAAVETVESALETNQYFVVRRRRPRSRFVYVRPRRRRFVYVRPRRRYVIVRRRRW